MSRPQGGGSSVGMGTAQPWPAAQLQAHVADRLDARRSAVAAAQVDYLVAHGRYWQGLPTHTAAPVHTTARDGDAPADRLGSAPTDQPHTWDDTLPGLLVGPMSGRWRVDVYDGPAGKGYTLTVEAVHDGTLRRRTVNVGPETYRERDWHTVPPAGIP
jgi:hypothetical protein